MVHSLTNQSLEWRGEPPLHGEAFPCILHRVSFQVFAAVLLAGLGRDVIKVNTSAHYSILVWFYIVSQEYVRKIAMAMVVV